MIGELLRHILLTDGGVSAITTTIHPAIVPNNKYPKITYELVTTENNVVNEGVKGTKYNYQLDCYSPTSYGETETMAKAVIAALNTYEDSSIQKILVTDAFDGAVATDPGKDSPSIFRKTIKASIAI